MIPWFFVIVLLVGMLVHLALGLYSRRFRARPVQLPFEILMYICAVWAASFALDISTDNLGLKIILMQVRFLGLPFVTLLLLIIAVLFTGHGSWLSRQRIALLSVIPAATTILALMTEYTPLLRYDYTVVATSAGFTVLGFSNGVWSIFIYSPFTYALEIVSVLLLLWMVFSAEKIYARQALLFFVAVVIPIVSEFLFSMGISPVRGYDVTTSTFVITGILLAIAVFRYRFIDIIPIARSTLFERMADPMLVIDPEGRLADFNAAAGVVLGLERTRDLGIPFEVALSAYGDLHIYVEHPDPSRSTIALSADTGLKIFEISVVVLASGPDAPPLKMVHLREITERRRAEEKSRESAEYLNKLIDYANAPIIVWSPDFTITRFNQAFERLTGMTEQEIIGQHLEKLFPTESRDASLGLIKRTLDGEQWESVKIPILSTDGTILTVLWNSANILTSGAELVSTIAQGVDITMSERVEEALRISEEEYRSLFGNLLEGYASCRMIYDVGGRPADFIYLRVNPAFDRIIGTTSVTGKKVTEVFSGIKEAYPQVFEIYGRVAMTGQPETFEIEFSPAGKWLHISVYSSQKEHFVAIFEDITERKKAEQALRESEEKYREFFTTSRDCVFITSPEGEWIDFNDAAMEMFGYAGREEFARTSIRDLYDPPEQRAAFITKIEREGFVKEQPIRLKRNDGRIIDTLITAIPLRNPDGNLKAFIGTIRDVTEKKKAEERIRWLASFPELNPNPVVEMDAEGRITYTNPATRTMLKNLGLPEDPGVFVPGDKAEILRILREGTERQLDREITVDGEVFAETVSLNRNLQVIRIYTHNVSRQKQAERQREHLLADLEQKNAELERFTYTVSHDLKSPLITIRGFTGLIEADVERGDSVQLNKDLGRIATAADTMQELLTDLLELSRIGKIAKPPEKIAFGTIVRESAELLAVPLGERGVRLEIAPDLPEVYVDHARIRQAMNNLIENAVKFSGDRPDPVIKIGVEYPAGTPVFFVQDNGIGLDSRYLKRIFNLFEKLDVSVPGTGIGLTTVRRIVEVHGGKIWAESEGVGKGMTFRFTLPVMPGSGGRVS